MARRAWNQRKSRRAPPSVSHPEVVQAQSSAHILFVPFDFNSPVPEVVRTSAPGKLGDYLACGTPILAHVPQDTFVRFYLTKYQCGLVADCDSAEDLKKTLIKLLEDQNLRNSIGEMHCSEPDLILILW
jgi:glycosyltransferase involved in cell wall biosynthesis